MQSKLIIEGNAVYEIDEECLCQKEKAKSQKKPEKVKQNSDKRKQGGH